MRLGFRHFEHIIHTSIYSCQMHSCTHVRTHACTYVLTQTNRQTNKQTDKQTDRQTNARKKRKKKSRRRTLSKKKRVLIKVFIKIITYALPFLSFFISVLIFSPLPSSFSFPTLSYHPLPIIHRCLSTNVDIFRRARRIATNQHFFRYERLYHFP